VQNLLFVHGTGVREASYKLTLEFVTGELKAEIPQLARQECYWANGGHFSARCGLEKTRYKFRAFAAPGHRIFPSNSLSQKTRTASSPLSLHLFETMAVLQALQHVEAQGK
jgi:hypothetical protein